MASANNAFRGTFLLMLPVRLSQGTVKHTVVQEIASIAL